MTAEAYLDGLRATMAATREAELERVQEELAVVRREAAQQRRDATRWRQEAERLLRSTGQEVAL